MDAAPAPPLVDRRIEVMQHLMVHDVGDKIIRKLGVIQKSMDFDDLFFIVVVAKQPMSFGACFGSTKPTDRKSWNLIVEIGLIQLIENFL